MMYDMFLDRAEEFIFAEDEPERADIIFVPGNGFPQNAERAAQLYHAGFSPFILPSGRYSIVTGSFSGVLAKVDIYNGQYQTEWEFMRDVLLKNGVPDSAILKEDRATFTYENSRFSRQVTDRAGINVQKAIICCKTYHARRSLMYYQLAYPEAEFFVCPSCVDGVNRETWRDTLAGRQAVTGEIARIVEQFPLML